MKRDGGDALSGATYGLTSSLNGVTGIAGSVAGTAESTTSGAVGTVEKGVAGALPGKFPWVILTTKTHIMTLTIFCIAKRQLGGLGTVVGASLTNDLSMLSGSMYILSYYALEYR